MKNILLVALLLATLFVADATPHEASRGEWHKNVFVSEFFGLLFTLPDGWYDEPQNGWQPGDWVVMYAEIPVLYGSEWFLELVMLSYRESDLSAEDYLARVLVGNVSEHAGDELLRALQIQDHTTRIGRYDWHSYSYWGLDGGFARVFVRAIDGYMQQILIFYGSEPMLDEILEQFSPLEQ